MFETAPNEESPRRRFGLTEAVVVVAILLFGGFALVSDGRQSVDSVLAGYAEAVGR